MFATMMFITGIRLEKLRIVEKSLAGGADVNIHNQKWGNALWYAIKKKNCDLVRTLIKYGIDVNWHPAEYATPIEYACIYGNAPIIKELVKAKCVINFNKSDICQRLAARNRIHTLRYLIDQGLKPDICGWDGRTGLHWAAQEGYLRIVKLLVEEGADVNIMDKEGQTPLRIASGENHLEIVGFLLEHGAKVDLSIDGDTPLQIASAYGYVKMVKLLLSYGAAVDEKDDDGRTALFYAKARRQKKIQEILIEAGANGTLVDNFGISMKDLDRQEVRKKVVWDL